MKLLDKLLRWNELRVQLKAAERVGMELASENADLRIENALLRREIERLEDNAPRKAVGR
jgi:regulator of replication initiation timing